MALQIQDVINSRPMTRFQVAAVLACVLPPLALAASASQKRRFDKCLHRGERLCRAYDRPDEIHEDLGETLARVVHLLRSGERTQEPTYPLKQLRQ